jgi:hypothetical protein
MPYEKLLKMKTDGIRDQLQRLEKRERVVARVGDVYHPSYQHELEFQRRRIAQLESAAAMTDDEIEARIHELESELNEDEKACIYGDCRDLPWEKCLAVALIEDLEVVLGVHPSIAVQYPGGMGLG